MKMNELNAKTDNEAEPKEKIVHFGRRNWLGLVMALALAALWFEMFGLKALLERECVPSGLGTAVFVFALFGVTLAYLGKRAVWNKSTVLLLTACLLMGINCFVYASPMTAAINCVMIFCVGSMTIFVLAGRLERPVHDFRVIGNTVALGICALFVNIDKPFRALPSIKDVSKKHIYWIVAGAAVSVPLLALVIWLLSSADAVFGSLLKGIPEWLENINAGTVIWHIVRTVVLGLMFSSALYFLTEPGKKRDNTAGSEKAIPATMFAVVMALLNVIYIIFVVIQFAFLFGGRETAAMNGGYAEYARNGFFQLVTVSVINLGAVLISVSASGPDGLSKNMLRVLSTLLIALTAVILASAAYRMWLYISAYGLSYLRALTLWGMAVIALLLIAACVKVFVPKFRFWPVLLSVTICMWLIFSYSDIDCRMAEYNADRYLDGSLEEVDISYLSCFPEAESALRRLTAEKPDCGDVDIDDVIKTMEENTAARKNWKDITLMDIIGR